MAKKPPKTTTKRKTTAKTPAAKNTQRSLPSAWQITKHALETLWQHKRLFIGIVAVYAILNLLLVQGLVKTGDVNDLKQQLNQAFDSGFGSLTASLGVFTVLAGSAASGNTEIANAYQLFVTLICSLAIIWALRQVLAGYRPSIRDTFYKGMYPLVPFTLVLLVIGLQLLPLVIGSTLYAIVLNNAIAVHAIEKLLWGLATLLLSGVTLYWLTSSLFAAYIAAIPDVTPLNALRAARELVHARRWLVLRKLLFIPVLVCVIVAIIMVPIIVWLTQLAPVVFFVIMMCMLPILHAYMYTLYRELLDE